MKGWGKSTILRAVEKKKVTQKGKGYLKIVYTKEI